MKVSRIKTYHIHDKSVSIIGFWINDLVYCTLKNKACDFTLQFTVTHTLVSTGVTSLQLFGSSSPSSWFPNCPQVQLLAFNSSIS
jgi:hypothetical protein